MSSVSVGRSLVLRQGLLSGLVLGLGGYGWILLSGVEGEASLVQGDAGSRIAGAIHVGQWSLAVAAVLAAALVFLVSILNTRSFIVRPLAELAVASEQVVAGGLAAKRRGRGS